MNIERKRTRSFSSSSSSSSDLKDSLEIDKKLIANDSSNDNNASDNNVGEFKIKNNKKEKKRKRNEDKFLNKPKPSMSFDKTQFDKRNNKFSIHEVRDLILHLSADGPKRSWMNVSNHSSIDHTLILMIPGITCNDIGVDQPPINSVHPFSTSPSNELENNLPIFNKLFSHALPVRAPGDAQRLYSPAQSILNSPIPAPEKKRLEQVARAKAGVNTANPGKLSPPVFLLDIDQMKENGYPLPSWVRGNDGSDQLPKYPLPTSDGIVNETDDYINDSDRTILQDDGWLETPKLDVYIPSNSPRVYGLDCEMVMTDHGSALARVTLVDFKSGYKIMDDLVKPSSNIVDYLTKYSGITKEILDDVKMTQEEIQLKFAAMLTPSTILIGHSLESDLKALKLRHPWVIDTALIYEHPKRAPFKPSLKWLMKKWCDKEIQKNENGHDPEEDARSCLELLNKKLTFGRNFGTLPNDFESIFSRLNRCSIPLYEQKSKAGQTKKCGAVIDYGQPGQFHGSKAKTSIGCKNDDEIIDGCIKTIQNHDLVYGRLTELQISRGWASNSQDKDSSTNNNNDTNSVSSAPLKSAFEALNRRLETLYENLPSRTALIIISPHNDPRPSLTLNQRRLQYNELFRSFNGKKELIPQDKVFNRQDDETLLHEAEIAKFGITFFCVK